MKKSIMLPSLHSLFIPFGPILEIVIIRSPKLRGQAFIIFEEVKDATEARGKMNGFVLGGRPMGVEYAKQKSDRVARFEGTYVKREKRSAEDDGEAAQKRQNVADLDGIPAEETAAPGAGNNLGSSTPSNILLLTSLPSACNSSMLTTLFSQYPGFVEARKPPNDDGIGFVEFTAEGEATVAKDGLNGFRLTKEVGLNISYGKGN